MPRRSDRIETMADTPTELRRRWSRFSLRALLLLVVVICTALGWTLHKVREQGIAVAELEKLGCNVNYGSNEPTTNFETLRRLLGEEEPENVCSVDGQDHPITDAELRYVEGFASLEELTLGGTDHRCRRGTFIEAYSDSDFES